MQEGVQFSYFPIKSQFFHLARKKLLDNRWIKEKVINPTNIEKDKAQLKLISEEEKDFLKKILIFFLVGDGVVEEIIEKKVSKENATRRAYERQKVANEDIHNEVYSELLLIFMDYNKVNEEAAAYKNHEFIVKKISFIEEVCEKNFNFSTILMEGIFFSASFCSIFYFKNKNLFPTISEANEYIAKDEGFHTTVNIFAYNEGERLTDEEAEVIMKKAVEIENFFIDAYCPDEIGINKKLLKQYVEFIADFNMEEAKHKKIYNSTNPFSFMINFGKEAKADFFNKKPTEYNSFKKQEFVPLYINNLKKAHQ